MKILKLVKRIILCIVLLIFVGTGSILYAKYIEPDMLVTKKVSVEMDSLESPVRMVFFSDTHFGALYDQYNIEGIVAAINRQNPDLVLFGGDFYDRYSQDKQLLNLTYLSTELAKIQATHGKVAVWGNHDYGGAAISAYREVMEAGGFDLLKNQRATIKELGITISGLDDYLLGDPYLDSESMNEENLNIVLSHAPDLVDELTLNHVDLVLSGHSHGGQVYVPFITKKFLPPGGEKYVKGMYEVGAESKSQLFVTKGIGTTTVPYRFMNTPEIVVIDLVPEKTERMEWKDTAQNIQEWLRALKNVIKQKIA